jgi:hypothetical protein
MIRGHNWRVCLLAALGLALLGMIAPACSQDKPTFETWAPVVPDQPDENAGCIDGEWCWIHPSPSPYSMEDLQPTGGQAYAVGRASETEPWRPAVLGGGVELVDIPIARLQREDPSEVADDEDTIQHLKTTRNGWLVLSAGQGIYDIDASGSVDSTIVPATANRWDDISGVSLQTFVLSDRSDSSAMVRREGSHTRYNDMVDARSTVPRGLRMWPDGTIWQIGPVDLRAERFTKDTWIGFPSPGTSGELDAFGPGPDATCSEQGVFAATADELHRWNEPNSAWTTTDYDGGAVTSIGCDHRGNLALTDDDGRLHRRTDGGWTSNNLDDRPLRDVRPVETAEGPQTWVTGEDGMLAKMSDGEIEVLTTGFRLPDDLARKDRHSLVFTDVWMNDDGSRGVFLHESGFYHGSGNRWRSVPNENRQKNGSIHSDEVWGVDKPEFAISSGQLFRWTGSQWVISDLGIFEITGRVGPKDLDGTSARDVWLIRKHGIERFNGDAWSNVVQNDALNLQEILIEPDGNHIVAGYGTLYRLNAVQGGWSLEQIEGHPCERVDDLYREEDGSLYVAGAGDCIGRRSDGEWTRYPFSFRSDATFDDNGSKHIVPQPDEDVPLIATETGLVEPRGDGTLRSKFEGSFTGAAYLPERNITIVLSQHGAMANYHSENGN